MREFDKYHEDGKILPRRKGGTARHEYGLELQKLTGQHKCVYCGMNLTDNFNTWLLLSVDHVIPNRECQRLGIPKDWAESYSNLVLSCLGCNGLDNRYQITGHEPKANWTPEEFFCLRDEVFEARKKRIEKRRTEEVSFYASHPWEVS